MRDGRITGAERATFERHVAGCPTCSREVRALDGLARTLRTNREDTAIDELFVRRERTRLLAAFDRLLIEPERPRSVRRRLLGPAAAVALVAGLVVAWRGRPAVHSARVPSAVVHADATAVWSKRTDGNREEVVLERGELWIHVIHSSGEGRLVVMLPDGELEDTGTTFSVSAEDGHTTRVAVQEGSVVLRRRGQPEVGLGPGDTWMPDARPATSADVPAAAAAVLLPDAPSAPPLRSPPQLRASAALASGLAPDPSIDFRAAMAALDVGHNADAAAAFASFLVDHPRDPRAEDAAYLRVIALQRGGDSGSVKQAAQEYLRRYPAGFRRAEMETLGR